MLDSTPSDSQGRHLALLLVDVQRDFFSRPGLCPAPSILIDSLAALLDGWRAANLPVFHIRTRIHADGRDRMPHWKQQEVWACVEGTPGYEPPEALESHADEPVMHKPYFSAFGCRDLLPLLERAGIRNLVVAGLYTHACVRASVVDAYERGFRVWIAGDAVGSTEPVHAEASRLWLGGRVAKFAPTSELLDWVRSATTKPQHQSGPPDTPIFESQGTRHVKSQNSLVSTAGSNPGERWTGTDPPARAALLERWADNLEDESDGLAELLAREIGKPVIESADEIRRTLAHIRVAARLCLEELETVLADGVHVRYRPIGTVAVITPWNNPLAIPAGKLAPALAFGNCCVWKPAPQAMACAHRLYEALQQAGLPEGVVGMVAGGADMARSLIMDTGIDAVTFTGSNKAGQAIASLCAVHQKPLQAEMGGNNAAIILDDWRFSDADLVMLAQSMFGFAGQRCTAIRRLIVQNGIIARFTEAFAVVLEGLAVGDPMDPGNRVGPLISPAHREQLEVQIEEAVANGAHIIARGSVPKYRGSMTWDGHWLSPILLGGVLPHSDIAQEESFGPIGLIMEARDLDNALKIANAVPHGLVAALYSNETAARDLFAERAQAGMLKLGPGPMVISAEAPFSGWKASAIGPPEHGIWDRQFYTKVQTVYQ